MHGGTVTDDERQAAVTAMHEAILAVHNMMQFDAESDAFHETLSMSHAALVALEAAGFKVVRNA
jgi:hypothetical protein